MIKEVGKIVGILMAIEIALFFAMVITSMTDEKPPFIAGVFYWILKYILGFPLVLIDNNYPFFLAHKNMPVVAVPLIILNNIILALVILKVKRLFR